MRTEKKKTHLKNVIDFKSVGLKGHNLLKKLYEIIFKKKKLGLLKNAAL